jgi:magnesium transporter
MNLANSIPDVNAPVVEHARRDLPLLDAHMTVGEVLGRIRREGVGERVIYFCAIDEEKRLVGVVPTRRLLTAPLETALREVMARRVVAVPAKATVLDACEFFVLYKFLAFPVVDEQRRVVGIIDANLFAEEILEAGDTEDRSRSREAVPSLLHRLKLDPKIAAGPVTLVSADFIALVIYFTSAWLVLR